MTKNTKVTATSIRSAIDGFLELLNLEEREDQMRLKQLVLSLDRLVAEYWATNDIEPTDDETEAPSISYDALYQQASASFPDLGYYSHVYPDEDLDSKIGLADAIDDIADIARDLSEVLWYFDQERFVDGIWQFRFGYQSHWGVHLHSLRVYLHSTEIAAWWPLFLCAFVASRENIVAGPRPAPG